MENHHRLWFRSKDIVVSGEKGHRVYCLWLREELKRACALSIVCIVYDSLYDTRQALLRLPEQSVGLATLAVREELCFAIKNTDDCKRLGLTPPPVREDFCKLSRSNSSRSWTNWRCFSHNSLFKSPDFPSLNLWNYFLLEPMDQLRLIENIKLQWLMSSKKIDSLVNFVE